MTDLSIHQLTEPLTYDEDGDPFIVAKVTFGDSDMETWVIYTDEESAQAVEKHFKTKIEPFVITYEGGLG